MDRDALRPAILLATVINHPELLAEVDEDLGQVAIADADLDNLRQAILITHAGGAPLDTGAILNHLSEQGYSRTLDRLLSAQTYDHARFARPQAGIAEARQGWEATINHLRGEDLQSELQAARRAAKLDPSDENLERVVRVRRMMEESDPSAAALD